MGKKLLIMTLALICLAILMSACTLGSDHEDLYKRAWEKNAATINIAAITGIAPVHGATPVREITANDQYKGTVTWSPELPYNSTFPFGTGTMYTATITLEAKPRFTLKGVTANFFTVDGAAAVSNHPNSGVVTAVFPNTGKLK